VGGSQPGNITFKIPSGGCFQIAVSAFGYGDAPGSLCDDQLSIVFFDVYEVIRIIWRVYLDVLICILHDGAVCI
jgi:hypothetical protein